MSHAAIPFDLKTITSGNEHLRDLGKKFLWEGAQEIVFREI